jgi:hypothetical protein
MNNTNINSTSFEVIIETSIGDSHLEIEFQNNILNDDLDFEDYISRQFLHFINEVIEREHSLSCNARKLEVPIIKYNEIEQIYDNKNCSICLDDFKDEDEVYQLDCSHVFHKSCFDEWFKRSNKCPLCKNNI